MPAAPHIVPILATPFGVVPLPEAEAGNAELVALVDARIRSGGSAVASTHGCRQGDDDFFGWQEPSAQVLRGAMLSGVGAMVEAVNRFSDDELTHIHPEARAWFTVVEQDGYIPAVAHPLTAWCAVYCIMAPTAPTDRQDSGILRLHESRLGTMFQDATNATMRIPYLTGHYGWRPVPGQMAVFPACVTHEVALLRAPGRLILVTARVRYVASGQQGWGRW